MKKVLFIGNSHTYFNDMAEMVKELAFAAGEAVHVTMLTKGGMSLDWHAQQEQTAFNLRYGDYDFCVLQQVAHPFGGYDALADGVQKIRALAGQNAPRFVLYMTWAEKIKPENQEKMSEAYCRAAKEQKLGLAPVGEIWQKFRAENPDIELYFSDGEHASPAGSFLAASTIFSVLFQKKLPEEIDSEAVVLQRIDPEIRKKIMKTVDAFLSETICK